MQNDCQVTTAELDQVVPSRHIAYRHDHGRMATLGINNCVTIFAPGDSEQQWELLCQTQLEECTPVQGCWAHADFGAILAVLTDEGDIAILEEASKSSNIMLREQARILHKGCQVLSFGPKEGGLQLASACSGSHIRLQAAALEGTSKWCRIHQAERSEAGWDWVLQHEFEASDSGACTAMCWRPHTASLPPMILLGTQHGAKVYSYDSRHRSWKAAAHFMEDTVTDVAWATPAAGQAPESLATASGRSVSVWKLAGSADHLQVSPAGELQHAASVCQIEWNANGTWLAVATEDGTMSLWRQNLLGSWKLVTTTSRMDPGSFAMLD